MRDRSEPVSPLAYIEDSSMKIFALAALALAAGSVARASDVPPQNFEDCHHCGMVQGIQVAYDSQQHLKSMTYIVAMGGGPETRSVTYDTGEIPAIRPGTSVQVSDDGKSLRPLK